MYIVVIFGGPPVGAARSERTPTFGGVCRMLLLLLLLLYADAMRMQRIGAQVCQAFCDHVSASLHVISMRAFAAQVIVRARSRVYTDDACARLHSAVASCSCLRSVSWYLWL